MRNIRSPSPGRLVAGLLASLAAGLASGLAAPCRAAPIAAIQSTYLMRCGGCHGIEGVSVPGLVPSLRNQVGVFTCSAEGRDYMLRVPNVAMSRIDDDRLLASVMNFVTFTLGGSSTPSGTRPFTAAQVHAARAQPLDSTDLEALRSQVLARAIKACAA